MKYSHILFDLDGTLTDSAEGITKCVAHALKDFGIEVQDLSQLRSFVGPPLEHSFAEEYGLSPEQIRQAIARFRERFSTIGKFENRPYDGIIGMLQTLKANGKKLYVATSKPMHFAIEILEHFEMAEYFEDIIGAELNGNRTHKDEVIAYVLQKHDLIGREDVIMIGDRKYDILGARENHIPAIGVLYGYGNFAELKEAGAEYIAEDIHELTRHIIA